MNYSAWKLAIFPSQKCLYRIKRKSNRSPSSYVRVKTRQKFYRRTL